MRIDGQPPYIVEIKRPEPPRPSEPVQSLQQPASAGKAPSQERVVISSRMREIERLRGQLEAIPEVRLDMVALAKQQMQYGSYRVEPGEVAQKLVESLKR